MAGLHFGREAEMYGVSDFVVAVLVALPAFELLGSLPDLAPLEGALYKGSL